MSSDAYVTQTRARCALSLLKRDVRVSCQEQNPSPQRAMSFTAQLPHTVASSRQADSRLRGRVASHAATASATRPGRKHTAVSTLTALNTTGCVPCTPAPQSCCAARSAQTQQRTRRGGVVVRAEASPAASDEESIVVVRLRSRPRLLRCWLHAWECDSCGCTRSVEAPRLRGLLRESP